MKYVWAMIVVFAFAMLGLAWAQGGNVVGNQHTPAGTLEGSHQFTGNRMTATSVTWHTIAPRWLMVFDTQTMPPAGQLGPTVPLIVCQFIQGAGNQTDGSQNYFWTGSPIIVTTGVLVVISVNPQGCTAMTPDGANDWITGQMQG